MPDRLEKHLGISCNGVTQVSSELGCRFDSQPPSVGLGSVVTAAVVWVAAMAQMGWNSICCRAAKGKKKKKLPTLNEILKF